VASPYEETAGWLGSIQGAAFTVAHGMTIELVAGVDGKRIVVLALAAATDTAGPSQLTFKSGDSALTGEMYVASGGPLLLPWCPAGWFHTARGQALNVTNSAAMGTADGVLRYVLVPTDG